MALQNEYGAKLLNDVVGNKSCVTALRKIIDAPVLKQQVFLFTGIAGSGKTTMPRVIANELDISPSEIIEVNASSQRNIDDVRAIEESAKTKPMFGKYKLYLIDEAHSINSLAQDCFLRLLNEPPPHVIICLCTTDPNKLKIAVRRRCHTYNMESLTLANARTLCNRVLKETKQELDKDIIKAIHTASNKSGGDILKLLDMVLLDPENYEEVLNNIEVTDDVEIKTICQQLINKGDWNIIRKVLKETKSDPESARKNIVGYLNTVLLDATGGRAFHIADIMGYFIEPFYEKGGLTLACFLVSQGE